MAFVYRHIRHDTNQVFYIGISKRDSPNFERAYNSYIKHRNRFWINVTAKTGYDVEILFENIEYEKAKEKEREFIEIYKRVCDGGTLVNLTKGGDGVLGFKNPKLSERNKTGLWRGKKHTEEWKRKQSERFKGRKMSEEQKKQASIRLKESGIYKGVNNPRYTGPFTLYKDGLYFDTFTTINDAAKAGGFSYSVARQFAYKPGAPKRREEYLGWVIKAKRA